MTDTEQMTPLEAGAFIKKKRLERGLTQAQAAEQAGLPSDKYLSAFENGKFHIGKSQHLQNLARVLNLTNEEIKALNPNIIFAVEPKPEVPGPNPVHTYREEGLELPESLKIAIERYGEDYPEFRDPEWQQSLAGVRFRGEPIDTPREWLEYLQFALRVLSKRKR